MPFPQYPPNSFVQSLDNGNAPTVEDIEKGMMPPFAYRYSVRDGDFLLFFHPNERITCPCGAECDAELTSAWLCTVSPNDNTAEKCYGYGYLPSAPSFGNRRECD
jgi:hypothetical protein